MPTIPGSHRKVEKKIDHGFEEFGEWIGDRKEDAIDTVATGLDETRDWLSDKWKMATR
jgi:hypothetical protein